ncbi:MAG: ECF transporter S component [Clostridia bacterium]
MSNSTLQKSSKLNLLIKIAFLAAFSFLLSLFELPLPFFPPFLKIDLATLPALIGSLALGPWAGAVIALLGNLLKILISGSTTGGVGDLVNFLVAATLCVTAGSIYQAKHGRKGAMLAMLVGVLFMTIIATLTNYYVMFPLYAKVMGFPLEAIIASGTALNANVTSLFTFMILMIVPFNLLKGAVLMLVTFLLYKKLSPILKK